MNVKAVGPNGRHQEFDATTLTITTEDAGLPIQIEQLDNGEIVVLYDGECFLSVLRPKQDAAINQGFV
jgi:hypothetical protein